MGNARFARKGKDPDLQLGSAKEHLDDAPWGLWEDQEEVLVELPPKCRDPSPQGRRGSGTGPASGKQAEGRQACPICGDKVDAAAIQAHTERCLDLSESATLLRRPGNAAKEWSTKCVSAPGGGTLPSDVQKWAEEQIAKLAFRFCGSKLNATVALVSLTICTSAAEMNREAAALLGENPQVRSFAAELWKRSAGAMLGRR